MRFELGEMHGQIAVRQARPGLQVLEVGAPAQIQNEQQCQPRRLVHDAVDTHDFFERFRQQRVPRCNRNRTNASVMTMSGNADIIRGMRNSMPTVTRTEKLDLRLTPSTRTTCSS